VQGKAHFLSVKVWGKFKFVWNKFDSVWKTESGALCCRPHLSAPTPLSSHSLSHRQPGPACQLCRRAACARRDRATVGRDEVGTPPVGQSQAIIFDRGSIFVAHFWEQLHECLGTHLIRSSAYHPQTDGQTERVNEIIEDMLHACVLTDGPKWDKHLPLVEFSYNNIYQESINMSPFEALYGWPCRTPLSWSESGKRVIFGPDIVTEAKEKVKQIQANILAALSRQKS
jgi:hypothetical protein